MNYPKIFLNAIQKEENGHKQKKSSVASFEEIVKYFLGKSFFDIPSQPRRKIMTKKSEIEHNDYTYLFRSVILRQGKILFSIP